MNVSPVQTPAQSPVSMPNVEAKRAAFQAALLKKSVQFQQDQGDQLRREAEGKGQIVDIKV